MALKGLKVLELAGLAPGPFCGKLFADFGATVTRIDKVYDNHFEVLRHGKQTLAVNLKNKKGQEIVQNLAKHYDVLIEPFRPGVMEKLNLGPEKLCALNPRLIYARLTGFGQHGRLAARAGHDINYAAISGVLSMLGKSGDKPTPPINILADFAGGGLMCALGICMALLERHRSGLGQIIDAAMIDGAAYVASWLFMSRSLPIWPTKERGCNILDGSFFYDTYETKDGKYMSVGALEPEFFDNFKNKLGLPELEQHLTNKETAQKMLEKAFMEKTQAEWSHIFEDIDACVYPVLEWTDLMNHDHLQDRSFAKTIDNIIIPKPAPRLNRTPGEVNTSATKLNPEEEALHILKDLDFKQKRLQELIDDGVIFLPHSKAKL